MSGDQSMEPMRPKRARTLRIGWSKGSVATSRHLRRGCPGSKGSHEVTARATTTRL